MWRCVMACVLFSSHVSCVVSAGVALSLLRVIFCVLPSLAQLLSVGFTHLSGLCEAVCCLPSTLAYPALERLHLGRFFGVPYLPLAP